MHRKKKNKRVHHKNERPGAAKPAGTALDCFFNRTWAAPLTIFCFALLLRVIYLIQFRDAATFHIPLVDSETYYGIARGLLAGEGYGNRPFWQPPLYPTFLALALAVTGENLFMVRFLQGLMGSLSCVLLYFVGMEFFSRSVAFLAALMAACYGVLIFFDGELLAPVLIIFLTLLCFLFGLRGQKRNLLFYWGLSGFFLGLSAITWGSLLIFFPLLLLWAYRSRPEKATTGKALHRPLIVAAGLFLVILPVTLYNGLIGDDWVLISTNGGINFYIGNNEHADETVNIRPGYAWERLVNLPWYEARTDLASEDSAFFFRKSLSFIKEHPGAFFRHLLVKWYRFWNSLEISRNVHMYYSTRDSWFLRMLLWRGSAFCFPFGLLAPLALAGFVLVWRDRRKLFPAYGFIAALHIVVVMFFVTGRYRTPVIPVLLLYAAVTLVWFTRVLRERERGRLALFMAGFLLLVIFCNLPYLRPVEPAFAEIPYFAALTLEKRGRTEEAEAFCRRAIEEDPSYFRAILKQGEFAFRRGDLEEAYQKLGQVLDLVPDHPEANAQTGIVLAAMHHDREAHLAFKRAIELDPHKESFHYNLALNEIALGDLEAAMETLGQTADLAMDKSVSYPKIAGTVNRIAERMIQEGRPERALQGLEWAGGLAPAEKRTWKNLVAIHILLGHDPHTFQEEIRAFIRLAPEDPMAAELKNLLAYVDTIP